MLNSFQVSNLFQILLIKFSKQIGNSFAKILIQRRIQNPVKKLRWGFFRELLLASEVNSESCHTSKMELFAKTVKNEKPFTIFVKSSILDVWQGSEYASELASKVKDASFLNQVKCQR